MKGWPYRGSVMVSLDRQLVGSYRLSIVTISLSDTVWPQFALPVFGGEGSYPRLGEGVVAGGRNLYHCVSTTWPPSSMLHFFSTRHRLATIHFVTDRQTT